MSVILETSLGTITIDLFYKECPMAAENFLKLCKIKYYNGHLFYNVQANYIAQTGDPTGTGSGGSSIYGLLDGKSKYFNDEIVKTLSHSKMGTVGMASGGVNCNGSQFYITLRNKIDYLDGNHTIFGQVVDEDIETLDKFNHLHIDEEGRPLIDIRILHTIILEDPFQDDDNLKDLIPPSSPTYLKPKSETVPSRLTLEEANNNDNDNLTQEELEKRIKKQASKTAAVILEVVGDIPDAEMKPPENVLFICKLNPITEDKDLELIFSRFGDIKSCEIIRDYKTGDSLQYGFIEFENAKQCQDAYFKMDNTLIDDRRIHVDFSQSVGKLWNKFKKNRNEMTKGDLRLDVINNNNNNKSDMKNKKLSKSRSKSRSRSRSNHKSKRRSKSRSKSRHHHHHRHHKHSH